MLKVLFELFLLYLLYKIIFDFIIPLYQTTKQVKQKVNKMQQDINEQLRRNNNQTAATPQTPNTPKATVKDDYIDFEEVK
jgi:predicted Holliday junction resolvase-like endonuclease